MGHRPIGLRTNHYTIPGTGDPDGTIPSQTFTLDQLDVFLPELDYLALTLPLNSATRGIIGERELRLLRPSAVLLNPARGHLVDEAALLRALREQWFAGAALDTHFQYPLPPEHPLWSLPNAILTPHISGSNGSRHYLSRLWDLFAQNIERYLRDEPLLNELATKELSQ